LPPRFLSGLTTEEIDAQLHAAGRTVLTFLGYSASGYEDPAAMLAVAGGMLQALDRTSTVVNIGATEAGIGAVYALAKRLGFMTTGIVSTQAKAAGARLSSHVEVVFFVEDDTWGGFAEGTDRLTPTSETMVAVSDRFVAIGGGDVACAEAIGAQRAGKIVEFIPADMNHQAAREEAASRGLPPPTDFAGPVAALFRARRSG
jgi:hypothetical protein